MAFDVEGAKQAGYSDAEIAGHLASTMKFDAEGARKAGYSDQEIIAQLANPASAAPRWEEPNPTFAAGDPRYALPPAPIVRSLPASVADIVPRDGAVPRIVGATTEGFRKGMAGRTDPAALAAQEQFNRTPIIGPINAQLIGPAMKLAGGVMGAAGGGLGQGAYELGNLYSPELGRDAFMGAQVLPTLWPLRARIPSPAKLAAAPRVNPMMEAFDRAEATRAEQPSRPAPPDPVESNIAKFQTQIGVRDAPPPAPSGSPAERAPPGIPPGTEVPTSLQIQAAIDTADTQPTAPPRPSFAPAVNVDPMTGQAAPVVAPSIDRVPPGASGPATVPYALDDQTKGPLEAPGPRSVGGAASREGTPASSIDLTPEQAALYGSVADKQWLYKSKPPGEVDNTEYVKGIKPTMAQRELTIQRARETKAQRNLSPEAAQDEAVLLDEHNTIRKTEFQGTAGSDVTQGLAMDAAEKAIDAALGKAFSAGGEVNHQPITRAIQAERNAPSGKLPPVKDRLPKEPLVLMRMRPEACSPVEA